MSSTRKAMKVIHEAHPAVLGHRAGDPQLKALQVVVLKKRLDEQPAPLKPPNPSSVTTPPGSRAPTASELPSGGHPRDSHSRQSPGTEFVSSHFVAGNGDVSVADLLFDALLADMLEKFFSGSQINNHECEILFGVIE